MKGLRVEITTYARVVDSHSSFLDSEELDGLIGAIGYMEKLMTEWSGAKREPYTEVVFATRGDFKLGFYHKVTEQKVFASSGVIGRTDIEMDREDLPRLKELLSQAAAKLKTL